MRQCTIVAFFVDMMHLQFVLLDLRFFIPSSVNQCVVVILLIYVYDEANQVTIARQV